MSIVMERTVAGPRDAADAFAYLSDFTTTTEWDPGSISTERISGDGGVGTEYRNVSEFAGRRNEVLYTVTALVPGERIELAGRNSGVHLHDTITVRPHGPGSAVTYRVEFRFQGKLRWISWLLRPAVRKLVDAGADGLRQALHR